MRSITRRFTVRLPIIGSSSVNRRDEGQFDARAHRLTQDAMGNTDHAGIVHCGIRSEQTGLLALVDPRSTLRGRRAMATDDPHVSILGGDTTSPLRQIASVDDDRQVPVELRAWSDTSRRP